jgi:hypothetical protein
MRSTKPCLHTLALAAAGVIGLQSTALAEEATESVKTLVSDTTISGYVSTSAIWRPGTASGAASYYAGHFSSSAFHGGAKHDGFNLDVIDLVISKAVDESEWGAGYKAELWLGPDVGAFPTGSGSAHLAIKNAHVDLRAPVGNGLLIRLGVFDSILGYETANSPENAHFSRSLGWSVEPRSHTGLLLTYRAADWITASAGVANNGFTALAGAGAPVAGGNVNLINFKLQNGLPGTRGVESIKQYLGAVTLTAPDEWGFLSGSTLTFGAIDTPRQTAAVAGSVGNQDQVNIFAGARFNTPIERWKVGVAYDYVANPAIGVATGGVTHRSDYLSVWGLYNSFQCTEKLNVAVRAEYATGSSGAFTGIASTAADGDHTAAFGELTATVDYSLWENVISRLEFRWDTALSGGSTGAAGSADNPFGVGLGGADEKNAFIIAANIIYKF